MAMVAQLWALTAALVLRVVDGHGQLIVPAVRPQANGMDHRQEEPVYTLNGKRGDYSHNSMRCRDLTTFSSITQLTAGETFDVTWKCQACHPGDCYLWLSYDDNKEDPEHWFKIAEFPGCGAADGKDPPSQVSWDVTLPAELPSCEHCVLRWEWTAHQQVVNVEFYVQCADVEILSTAGPTKPDPIIGIYGIEHLSNDATKYRPAYNNPPPPEEWDDWLLGPEIATYSSCVEGSAGCISSSGSGPIQGNNQQGSGQVEEEVQAPAPSPVVAGSFYLNWVHVKGNYVEIIGGSYQAFLTACSAELDPVSCDDIGLGEGSTISITLKHTSEDTLDDTVSAILADGLAVDGYPLLRTTSGGADSPEGDSSDADDTVPVWVLAVGIAGGVLVVSIAAAIGMFCVWKCNKKRQEEKSKKEVVLSV